MNNAQIKSIHRAILGAIFLGVSAGAQAQLDLSGKVVAGIREEAHAGVQKGIDAYESNDFQAASDVFEPLAAKGDAIAQFYLGRMHVQGKGNFKPDYTEAFAFTLKSAEQELAEAEDLLGFMYYYGLGVAPDQKVAAGWLSKAAEQGVVEAQNNLGRLYDKGEGVPQDRVQAYKWFKLALNAGHEASAVRLKEARAKMTPQQLAQAEVLTSEWKPKHK